MCFQSDSEVFSFGSGLLRPCSMVFRPPNTLFRPFLSRFKPLSFQFHLVQASFSLVPSNPSPFQSGLADQASMTHYRTDPSVDPVCRVRLGSLAQLSKLATIGQTWPNPSTQLSRIGEPKFFSLSFSQTQGYTLSLRGDVRIFYIILC
jgi:hypothetical protein